ncbi:PDDEXK family nuclease [Piscirickettsia litoralis]|nr:hypothetical protein [Piscirickettsia litoralis]
MAKESAGERLLRVQCELEGLLVEQEYRFHPKRRWRFDFAMPVYKLAVEVEGGAYSQGRHTRGKGFEADCEKYNAAAELGWRVLRYTPQQVEKIYCYPPN